MGLSKLISDSDTKKITDSYFNVIMKTISNFNTNFLPNSDFRKGRFRFIVPSLKKKVYKMLS